jgi:hypothetical protein
VHGARHVRVGAEPVRRVTGQPGRADQRHSTVDLLVQVLPQHLVVQRTADFLVAGMGVRVDQAGENPAGGDELRILDRVGGPAVAVGVEVDGRTGRHRGAANTENGHSDSLGEPSLQLILI